MAKRSATLAACGQPLNNSYSTSYTKFMSLAAKRPDPSQPMLGQNNIRCTSTNRATYLGQTWPSDAKNCRSRSSAANKGYGRPSMICQRARRGSPALGAGLHALGAGLLTPPHALGAGLLTPP